MDDGYHCDECGFTYGELAPAELPDAIAAIGPTIAGLLTTAPDPQARRRPEQWSPVEYAAHLRDVLLVQRDRLWLARVEDTPSPSPMYRDHRIDLGHHGDIDAATAAREVTMAADLFRRDLDSLTPAEWDRTLTYNYPAPTERTIRWVADHTVHEGVHHAHDIRAPLD